MSKLTKRALPILILFLLTLSMFSFIAYADVSITKLENEDDDPLEAGDYDKGSEIHVFGAGVVAGVDINLYWDAVKAWDGEEGLLNSTEAESDGEYEVWFDVPEATAGAHYIWVKDTDAGDTASMLFTVVPKTSSPSQGLHTDTIALKGYGYGDEVDVAIFLITTLPGAGTAVVGEDFDTGDGDETEYDMDLEFTAIVPGSVVVTLDGVPTLFDNGDGTLDTGADEGDISYPTGEIDIEFDTAPAAGVEIEVNYEYYVEEEDELYIFTTTAETDEVGSWEKSVKVPKESEMDYGSYDVYAYDGEGNFDIDDLKIGAGISVDPTEGPTGAVVEIEGEGFDPAAVIDQGDVVIKDGTTEIECYIIDAPVDVRSNGDVKFDIVIPSVPDWDDYDEIHVTIGADTADDDFDIVGDAELEVTPSFGQPGISISIKGYNFTAISGEEVILELWDEDLTALEETLADGDDITTDRDGTFDETFDVPALTPDQYVLVAYQLDEDDIPYNVDVRVSETDENFKIGIMFLTITADDGATGKEVTIRGTGFTEDEEWNATFGDIVIFEDEPVSDKGAIAGTFYVPTVPVGTYDISVIDEEDEIEIILEFEVTNTTYAFSDPIMAPNEYNVTIEGYWFAELEDGDLEFLIYNVTDNGEIDEEWDMDVYNETGDEVTAFTNEDGNFTAWWIVLEDDDMSIGEYLVNVTMPDEEDFYAQFSFSIVGEEIAISPRKASFSIGETVSFNIVASFKELDSYIDIHKPDGVLYWKTERFADGDWIKVGDLQVYPFFEQTAGGYPMILGSDAPLGTWEWKWWDEPGDEVLDSGSFTVTSAPESVLAEQMEALSEEFSTLSDDFSDISGEFSGLSDDLADTTAAVEANADSLEDVADSITSIAGTADEAKSAADDAKSAADAAKTAANEAKTATSGLTTLVYGAIGASLVAALAAIVSLMQISRRIAG